MTSGGCAGLAMPDQGQLRDFFISFTKVDREFAIALNDALRKAGYTTWFEPQDLPLGGGVMEFMQTGLENAAQLIAVCSEAYFAEQKIYARAEVQAFLHESPTGQKPRVLLVMIEDCPVPTILAQMQRIELMGMQADQAAAALVKALDAEAAKKTRVEAEQMARERRRPAVFNVSGGLNPLFTGRDTELKILDENMRSNTATAITAVQGMGGIGKTSLAREYAHRYGVASRFAGVWWIPAESETNILAAYDELAGQLGASVEAGGNQSEIAKAVRDWLGQQPDSKPFLIIFDNAPDANAVKDWLPGGSAKVIITSRYEHFAGVATTLKLDFWEEDTVVRYLLDRAGRGSEVEARALAKRLGGLPLAAEQAGAFLVEKPTLSFGAYEQRLTDMLKRKPDNLSGDYPDSVYATFETALEALAEREHGEAALAILTMCAFLSPDGVELQFLTEAAQDTDWLPDPPRAALLDEVDCADVISALTAYALMRVGDDEEWGQMLHMHRLLADVARARLSGDDRTIWSGAAIRVIYGLMPGDVLAPSAWWHTARLVPHVDALASLPPGPGEDGKRQYFLLNQAGIYLDARGDRSGAIRLLRRSLEVKKQTRQDEPLQIAIAMDNLAGRLKEDPAHWDEAEDLYQQALEIKEDHLLPDDPSLAITLSNFGGLLVKQGKFEDAEQRLERAAEIFKAAHGETSAEYAVALSNLGALYYDWAAQTDDPDLKRELREKERKAKEQETAITRAATGPRHPWMTASLNNLAVMYDRDGDLKRAAEDMAACVAIFASLDNLAHPQAQQCIATLIRYWTQTGEADKAERLKNGDLSILTPYVLQIEEEHRQWVADDPENREWGPPSPVTGARD